MASPNVIFNNLVTTTLKNRSKDIADDVTKHNALYRRLSERRNTRKLDGGTSIVKALEYAENGTYQRYSGYDVLDIGASEVLSAAEYPWRNIALNVVSSGEELRKNSGQSRVYDLVRQKMRNAINTFKNRFSEDLYSDGTAANQINGLQAIISDTGGGILGGIDAGQWDFWKNQVQSAAAPIGGGAAVALDADHIEGLMRDLWIACTRGGDTPDLIVASPDLYSLFEESQVSMKRYTSSRDANGGFSGLKYKNADVVWDTADVIPPQHMYFINTTYLELAVHRDANLAVQDEKVPVNQDAVVVPVLWMGNLCCSNRARQGVLKA